MYRWLKGRLRDAVDRRVQFLLSQQDRSGVEGTLAKEIAELRDDIGQLRAALATAQERSAVIGWSGLDAPFAYHSQCAIAALSEGVAAVYGFDVEGQIAEFGTMTGTTARGLARAMASCDAHLAQAVTAYGQAPRELHLFDSFAGLPATTSPVDASSPHVQDGVWAPGTCRGVLPEELRTMITEFLPSERVRIFPGWFADTVVSLPNETRYAVLHIDADLYSSAMDVLVPLFARGQVQKGAYIFFDDWSCNRGDPALGERRAWAECVERFHIEASDQCAYGIFARCFAVHDYVPERG